MSRQMDLYKMWDNFSPTVKRSFTISALSELTTSEYMRSSIVTDSTVTDLLRAMDELWDDPSQS